MNRLCIICEGKTEAEFVKSCLAPYLMDRNITAEPILIGRTVNVERIVSHVRKVYRSFDYISTLVDYYGFGNSGGRGKSQLEAEILVQAGNLINGFDRTRVIPYIQMHEFEALLFSDIEQFYWLVDGWSERARESLRAIRNQFDSPEDINNSVNTAPSKRLENIFPGYDNIKAEYGPIIASDIGLPKIRQECPLFNAWVTRLERLGQN